MSKRIPKKVREEAAFCCQAAASTPWSRDDIDTYGLENAPYSSFSQFVWSDDAEDLAYRAWRFVVSNGNYFGGSEPWAEAEALLRCGWSP